MKTTGYLLLIGGFLGGAYATALDTQATDWALFLPAAVIAAAGVWLMKREERGMARSEEVLQTNRAELGDSLAGIVRTLDELCAGTTVSGQALRDAIDERLAGDLRRFAEARESLVHLFGMQSYANIMSEFAAGERYVNRVWSASADGYDGEAAAYLQRASEQFRRAQADFDKLAGEAPA